MMSMVLVGLRSVCRCDDMRDRLAALPSGPGVISVLSNEWELLNSDGRGRGRGDLGRPDNGLAALTRIKHTLLSARASAMHVSIDPRPAFPGSPPGSYGRGWRVLDDGDQAPLLSVPSHGDPAAPFGSAGDLHSGGVAGGGGVPVGGSYGAPLLGRGASAVGGGAFVADGGWRRAPAGSLLVSLDQRLVPILPGEQVVATTPSRRALTCMHSVGIGLAMAALGLQLASAVVALRGGNHLGYYPPRYDNDGNHNIDRYPPHDDRYPPHDDRYSPYDDRYPHNDDGDRFERAYDIVEAGALGMAGLVFVVAALGALATAEGGSGRSLGVKVPASGCLAAYSSLSALLVLSAVASATEQGGGFNRLDLVGAVAVLVCFVGLCALVTLCMEVCGSGSGSMGAVVLTTHRVITIAVRSTAHIAVGALSDDVAFAAAVDSWWLPLGTEEGFVMRGKHAAVAEVRVRRLTGSSALRFVPQLTDESACCACGGLRRTDLRRLQGLWSALMQLRPARPAVSLSTLPLPPAGALMAAAELDPLFQAGGYDQCGVAGRVSLLEGEAMLAYLDSFERPRSCLWGLQRFCTCGVSPAEAYHRLLLTDRRAFAYSVAFNRPACFDACLSDRADIIVFGPVASAASSISVASSASQRACACLRCPCEPDPSTACTTIAVPVAGVPFVLRRTAGLAPPAAGITPHGFWAEMADAPLLVHLQRVLAAIMAQSQAAHDEGRGVAPPSAYTDPRFGSVAPLQSAFPAPRGPPRLRPNNVPSLRTQWTSLVREAVPPPAAGANVQLFGEPLPGSAALRARRGPGAPRPAMAAAGPQGSHEHAAPGDEYAAPGDEYAAPGDEYAAPGDEYAALGDEYAALGDE